MDLTESLENSSYTITDSNNNLLEIISVISIDEDDTSELWLKTFSQTPSADYTVIVSSVKSINLHTPPAEGLRAKFSGFVPLEVNAEFEISNPGSIITEEPFTVTLTAKSVITDNVIEDFNQAVALTTTAEGNLEIISEDSWNLGVKNLTLKYTSLLNQGQNENIQIEASSADESVTGQSSTFNVQVPFTLAGFELDVPTMVAVNETFTVTIRAVDNLGNAFISFTDEVTLYVTNAPGILSVPGTISGFENGETSVDVSYNTLSTGLKLEVRSITDATKTGISTPIHVSSDAVDAAQNFSAVAVPVAVGTNRISFTALPAADTVEIEYESSPGLYTNITTLGSGARFYHHTGLTDSTAYKYRVTARDSTSTIILQQQTETTTMAATGCVTTVGVSTVSTLTNWDLAGSPYCLTGNVTVDNGGEIRLQRGVVILADPGVSITVTNTGAFVVTETGSGLSIFTSSDTSSPPAEHGGIIFTSTAGPTVFNTGTNTRLSGSVVRHMLFEFGGQLNTSTSLLVADSLFRHNGVTANGGALVTANDIQAAKIAITGSLFQNNYSNLPGGAAGFLHPGEILIESSVFEYNSTPDYGGAIYAINYSFFSMTDSFLRYNTSSSEGGGLYADMDVNVIMNNAFISNQASSRGGAAVIHGCPLLAYNLFKNNAAAYGGAIGAALSGPRLTAITSRHNYYESNMATGGDGGAIYDVRTNFNTIVKQSNYDSFTGNTATGSGGAVFLTGSNNDSLAVYNAYAESNSALSGGTIYFESRSAGWASGSVLDSVFFKETGDSSLSANAFFEGDLVTVNNSYFDNAGSGATDCTTGAIQGATSSCATPTPNSFKSDVPFPLCKDAAPGQDTPAGCVGPGWE